MTFSDLMVFLDPDCVHVLLEPCPHGTPQNSAMWEGAPVLICAVRCPQLPTTPHEGRGWGLGLWGRTLGRL